MAQIRVCMQAYVCGLSGYEAMVHLSKGKGWSATLNAQV